MQSKNLLKTLNQIKVNYTKYEELMGKVNNDKCKRILDKEINYKHKLNCLKNPELVYENKKTQAAETIGNILVIILLIATYFIDTKILNTNKFLVEILVILFPFIIGYTIKGVMIKKYTKGDIDVEDLCIDKVLSILSLLLIVYGAIGNLSEINGLWGFIKYIFLMFIMIIFIVIMFAIAYYAIKFIMIAILKFVNLVRYKKIDENNKDYVNTKEKVKEQYNQTEKEYDKFLKDEKETVKILDEVRLNIEELSKEQEKLFESIEMPEKFQNYGCVIQFIEYMEDMKLDTLKECIAQYKIDETNYEITEKIKEQNKLIEQYRHELANVRAKVDESNKISKLGNTISILNLFK